jgi:hypothetical protein
VLALAHFFDYASFLVMIGRHGLAAEANPVVVVIHEQIGLVGLTLTKVVFVAFAAALMSIIAARRRHLARALFVFGVMAGVIGGVSNVATI